MSHKLSHLVGLVVVVVSVAAGTANAGTARPAASFYSPEALRADGLRWRGLADLYRGMANTVNTADGVMADGQRLEAIADMYRRLSNAPAASFYTPEALKAAGQRWQAMASVYRQPQQQLSGGTASGFDWTDAGIGAAGGLGVGLLAAVLILGVRRGRQENLAV